MSVHGGNKPYPGQWHLPKIENPNRNFSVKFINFGGKFVQMARFWEMISYYFTEIYNR